MTGLGSAILLSWMIEKKLLLTLRSSYVLFSPWKMTWKFSHRKNFWNIQLFVFQKGLNFAQPEYWQQPSCVWLSFAWKALCDSNELSYSLKRDQVRGEDCLCNALNRKVFLSCCFCLYPCNQSEAWCVLFKMFSIITYSVDLLVPFKF